MANPSASRKPSMENQLRSRMELGWGLGFKQGFTEIKLLQDVLCPRKGNQLYPGNISEFRTITTIANTSVS